MGQVSSIARSSRRAPRRAASCALVALLFAACVAPAPDQARAPALGRVVVAPLNLGLELPEQLAGEGDQVWEQVLAYIRSHDRKVAVLEAGDARGLWAAAMAAAQEQHGKARDSSDAFEGSASAFAGLLAEEVDYQLLVLPSLVVREARLRGRSASWDGVYRRVSMEAGSKVHAAHELNNWTDALSGSMAGASIHVMVLHSTGRLLYQGLGGLDLIHEAHRDREASRDTWVLQLREEPLADAEHVREGVEIAFGRRFPRSPNAW